MAKESIGLMRAGGRPRTLLFWFIAIMGVVGPVAGLAGGSASVSEKKRAFLSDFARQHSHQYQGDRGVAERLARERGWTIEAITPGDGSRRLQGLDVFGAPVYYETQNGDAAITTRTDVARSLGEGEVGEGYTLAQWDNGGVYLEHPELTGRVAHKDGVQSGQLHATHVAGTLIAGGVDPDAKGMAPGANLHVYDWNDDIAELAAAALEGVEVTNHSYGTFSGWYQDNGWHWSGTPSISETEDWHFGFYGSRAADIDTVAYNAPNMTIVWSAGNERDARGSPATQPVEHYVFVDGEWVTSNTVRDVDGGETGYDTLMRQSVAKNILTVGAVHDVAEYTGPEDVVMASLSSWGPTDDGRIKPDLVGNGVVVYSSWYFQEPWYYTTYTGTSHSTPNVSGSLALLQNAYRRLHGTGMRSATLRGLAIHTADEAGDADGPDYRFGWGLPDIGDAMSLIRDHAAGSGCRYVLEGVLQDEDVEQLGFRLAGDASWLRATLSWTDPPGVSPAPSLDPPDLMLVNDLDLRVAQGGDVYLPWVLDPQSPSLAATRGDNFRDNLEKIEASNLTAGDYLFTISHKGDLEGGLQAWSLILDADADCAPNMAPSADSLEINGSPQEGATLAFSYIYNDLESDPEGDSAITWYVADNETGARQQVLLNESSASLMLVDGVVGRYVAASVKPVAQTGLIEGEAVMSGWVGPVNGKPLASSVDLAGQPLLGQVITLQYTYSDPESDPEGDSAFEWRLADNATGVNAATQGGAVAARYRIPLTAKDQYVGASVIPVASTGATPGEGVQSAWIGPIECPSGSVLYVHAEADGDETGLDWANAMTNVAGAEAMRAVCPNFSRIVVSSADDDGDGLSNLDEYYLGTDIDNPDSDGDALPDGWDEAPLTTAPSTCVGLEVTIAATFEFGDVYSCVGDESMKVTFAAQAWVKSGARVGVKAGEITIQPGFRADSGSRVWLKGVR